MKKYYFIHLLALFIFGKPLAAQETDLKFQYLGGSRGLTTSPVTSILQDRRGFMWFGTYEGLQRFDGYQCRTFRQRPDNQNTLSDNHVTCIFEDGAGIIWIGTSKGGLNRFDPKLEEFTHWVHSPGDQNSLSHNWVTEIIPAENGRLWLGTMGGGLNRFDPTTGQFERWLYNAESENSLGGNLVRAIHQDREGLLWIATANSGLNRFDPETGIFTHWRHEPENPRSLGNNTIADIHQDFTGRLWFAVGNSLDLLDQSTGHFTHWQYNPKHESSEGDSTLITLFGNPNQEENHLWLGTFSGRLNLFAKQSGNVTRFEFDAGSENGQRGNAVRAIYEDLNGTLWLGTLNGVYKATLHKKRYRIWQNDPEDSTSLSNDYTWSVYFGQDGAAHVGTMSGLNVLDRQSGTFRRWQRDAQNPDGLSGNAVLSVYEDKSGMLWLGTFQGGLNRFDRKTGQFTHWQHDAADPYSLDNNAVFSILEDRRGAFWVGSMAGINRFDRQQNRFERIQPKPDSLSSRRLQINAIYEDGSGAIWFGTHTSGLFRYDHESGAFENWSNSPNSHKSIGSNSISMICEDPEFGHRLIWFGTEGGGLNRLDVRTGEVRIISEKDGLPHNNVSCILTDSHKNLWISTDGGLVRLDPKTFDLQKYEVRAGDEPFQFSEFGAAKAPDGELYFAGKNGLLAFYPENMQEHASPPPVVLTDFQLFNKSVSPEPKGDSPLTQAISEADHIQLSHRQ
ncbi:MAG: two-component regulator propeller domain-containing protein, partial [bacterium]